MEAIKYDANKPRMDLLPPEAILGLASILTYGADKYADRNWEQGMDWGRIYAAVLRHLLAYWSGEDLDPESGLPHIDHALCGIAFLSTYQKRNIGQDTRNRTAQETKEECSSEVPVSPKLTTEALAFVD